MSWYLPVVLSGTLSLTAPGNGAPSIPHVSAAHDALLTAPERRVRSTDARIQRLLFEGVRRSTTFAGLLASLNATDVIVYIEPVPCLPTTVAGRLLLVPLQRYRYLRVQVRAPLTAAETIALIGHELQHALEIAAAPEVRDTQALVRLYERIGVSGTGEHTYDTVAAQTTGRQVRTELSQSPVASL